MRICTNCGNAVEDGETVCSVCNSDLITETDAETEKTVSAPDDISLTSDDKVSAPLFSSAHPVELRLETPESASAPEETAVPSEGDVDAPLFSSVHPVELRLEMPEPAEATEEAAVPSENDTNVPLFSSDYPAELRLELPEPAETPEDTGLLSGSAMEQDSGETASEITAPLFSFTTATLELDLHPDQTVPDTETGDAEPAPEVIPAEENDTAPQPEETPEPVTQETEKNSENENYKVVKVKVRNDQKLKNVNKERVAVVIIALLALVSVISAVFMIVVPLIQARRQDEAAKEAAYMEYLTGEWLSETFIYSGEEFPSCEVLTIGKNSTFISEIWTSPNDRETYDPETWTVTARQTGDLAIELATSSLRVSYTDSDGNVMVYRRYILKLDSSSLILREYYNEKMTDYYDVVFTRKGNS